MTLPLIVNQTFNIGCSLWLKDFIVFNVNVWIINMSLTPAAIDDPRRTGYPCFKKHVPGRTRSNQHATWQTCQKCALRLSYHTKNGMEGEHRQMGPHPHLVSLAQEALQKEMDVSQVDEKVFNGKLMELKGKMLQQGLTQTMAVNMTLEEYRQRLRLDNKMDPIVEEEIKGQTKGKKTRDPSPIPPPLQQTLEAIENSRTTAYPKSTAMGSSKTPPKPNVKTEVHPKELPQDVMVVTDSEEEKPELR